MYSNFIWISFWSKTTKFTYEQRFTMLFSCSTTISWWSHENINMMMNGSRYSGHVFNLLSDVEMIECSESVAMVAYCPDWSSVATCQPSDHWKHCAANPPKSFLIGHSTGERTRHIVMVQKREKYVIGTNFKLLDET